MQILICSLVATMFLFGMATKETLYDLFRFAPCCASYLFSTSTHSDKICYQKYKTKA